MTKRLADKMSGDKMPCRQNVTGQNTLQTKCHGTKYLADKMSQDKMPYRQNVRNTPLYLRFNYKALCTALSFSFREQYIMYTKKTLGGGGFPIN